MIDNNFVKLVEKIGYVNEHGEHVYGTAALLHVLHCPFKNLDTKHIARGKAFVEKQLSA